jgi:hypothetical protein
MRQLRYWLFVLALALCPFSACQQRAVFNPALAGRFFPLSTGSTWTYEVIYANGVRETISDHVVKANPTGMLRDGALVVSSYSGFDGSRAVRAELLQSNPIEMTEVEVRYVVEGGYITRVETVGGATGIHFEERSFLPQNLWPDLEWSNTLSPFEHSPIDILEISQNHRSFLETDDVVVPAGHFTRCIRIETEASYHSLAKIGDHKRYFTDWYAPDVGLVKTLVFSGRPGGHEIARIELLRFTKAEAGAPHQSSENRPIVPLSSKIVNPAPTASSLTDR